MRIANPLLAIVPAPLPAIVRFISTPPLPSLMLDPLFMQSTSIPVPPTPVVGPRTKNNAHAHPPAPATLNPVSNKSTRTRTSIVAGPPETPLHLPGMTTTTIYVDGMKNASGSCTRLVLGTTMIRGGRTTCKNIRCKCFSFASSSVLIILSTGFVSEDSFHAL